MFVKKGFANSLLIAFILIAISVIAYVYVWPNYQAQTIIKEACFHANGKDYDKVNDDGSHITCSNNKCTYEKPNKIITKDCNNVNETTPTEKPNVNQDNKQEENSNQKTPNKNTNTTQPQDSNKGNTNQNNDTPTQNNQSNTNQNNTNNQNNNNQSTNNSSNEEIDQNVQDMLE